MYQFGYSRRQYTRRALPVFNGCHRLQERSGCIACGKKRQQQTPGPESPQSQRLHAEKCSRARVQETNLTSTNLSNLNVHWIDRYYPSRGLRSTTTGSRPTFIVCMSCISRSQLAGSHPSAKRRSRSRTTHAANTRSSCSARFLPTQFAAPCENGTNASALCASSPRGWKAASGCSRPSAISQRSGQKVSGREKLRASWWSVQMGTRTWFPSGTKLGR